MSGIGAALRGISKILLKSSKQKTTGTGAINSVKIKKNLTGRRKDRDAVVKGVDKHLDSSDPKSSVIKKKYTDKTSAIYDKLNKKK
jgi:hypothetical protein